MPPRLRDYRLHDWMRLRPVTQGCKTWRYDAVNRSYIRRMPPEETDLAAIAGELVRRRVLVTVAFNDPQVIGWQIELLRRYVPRDVHLIADNSSEDDRAADIRAVAQGLGVVYVRLPANPERSSRGHGLALNWIWHNIIVPARPTAFGFLDDDFFPTAPDDPFAKLERQDFYGVVRTAGARWFLWAGFCLFRFDAVRAKPLDFRQDWFIGLDTGGANWAVLYRHADLSHMEAAPMVTVPSVDGIPTAPDYVQWSGTWLHEVGGAVVPGDEKGKRAATAALLAPHLGRPAHALMDANR